MKNSLLLPLLALAMFLPFAIQSSAQEGGGGDGFGFDGGAGPVAEAPTIDTVRFDVDLAEMPAWDAFSNIERVLKEAGVEVLNIVYSGDAEDIVLPSMRLRQITFSQFVSFINRIGGAPTPAEMDLYGGAGPELPPHQGPRFGLMEESGIWYFWAESQELKAEPQTGGSADGAMGFEGDAGKNKDTNTLQTTVFALEGDTEVTLGLIEETLAETRRYQERPEPGLKFHEPSSTLIVSATAEDLQIIEQVINVIASRAETERLKHTGLGDSSGMAMEIQALRMKLEQYEKAAEHREKAVVEAETRVAVLRAKLEETLAKYSKNHPTVKKTEDELGNALEVLKEAK